MSGSDDHDSCVEEEGPTPKEKYSGRIWNGAFYFLVGFQIFNHQRPFFLAQPQ